MNLFIIIKRLSEMFALSTILSLVSVLMNYFGLVTARYRLFVLLFVFVGIFVAINAFLMRRTYYIIRDKKYYYLVNFAAYFLFGVLSVIIYFSSNTAYTFMFSITKFLRYCLIPFSIPFSATVFHIINGIGILISPIGMEAIISKEEDAISLQMQIEEELSEDADEEEEYQDMLTLDANAPFESGNSFENGDIFEDADDDDFEYPEFSDEDEEEADGKEEL